MQEKIIEYCRLAGKQKNLALALLIEQVLSDKKVYTFGELLGMKSIAALKMGGDDGIDTNIQQKELFMKSYSSLELFAYGTYEDYERQRERYIDLSAVMIKKLKQLSMISLAMENKIIPYTILQEKLKVDNVRALEDLIIDTIYSGLITAKMNQYEQILRVQTFIGRDVRLEQLPTLIGKLTAFKESCEKQLDVTNSSTKLIEDSRERHNSAVEKAQKLFDLQREKIKASMKEKSTPVKKHKIGKNAHETDHIMETETGG